ncbi:hypothetical protein PTSG_03978 [Salpingoeca rosetta]|uniref:Tektin n=1 Tax=Salpingoeca rosetta (strain ATCC 50818 / BSB-021) TaxID=946362 RepID=F2U7F3_SALR5|nr:uncharacterized protein PTSG_03978 [Salpingoeca rosetta]EGD83370.1 hypothetical protein PTSG_03978 [Salpingoeca rosetta]|eukprot:XP_004994874.1 hypothetical protein PTSG_03978 [Salpingoeca rosetta]
MHRVHGTFHSTMQPMDLSIRGHNARQRQGKVGGSTIQLNLSRSFDGADQDALTLRREALMTKRKTTQHIRGLKHPTPTSSIRKETNAAMFDFEKDQKALVLSLREVEHAAIQQARKLERTTRKLAAFLEDHCRRAVWLNRESISRRGHVGSVPDAVTFELQNEQRVAKEVLAAVSKQHSINTGASHALNAALKTAASVIKHETKALSLNTESYSGSVQAYPRPQGTPPPVVVQLRDAIRAAASACDDATSLMVSARSDLAQAMKAVDDKLRTAKTRTRSTEADLHQTRGEARTMLHHSRTVAARAEVIFETNRGPREGRFHRIADSATRPRARVYQEAHGERSALHTLETKAVSHRTLAAAQRELAKDIHDLGTKERVLAATVRDCRRYHERDAELLRFRRRCQPGNRVPTRP